jgi:hypothetical protein
MAAFHVLACYEVDYNADGVHLDEGCVVAGPIADARETLRVAADRNNASSNAAIIYQAAYKDEHTGRWVRLTAEEAACC